MTLNIKDPQAYELANELSQLTGMSLTSVVINALQNQLALQKEPQWEKASTEELMAIGRRCAAHIDPSARATAHGDDLYDERGLPK